MSALLSPRVCHSSKAGKRRANSCIPCRDSKSKCSGGSPCTTCQVKRRKPRCYYLPSVFQDGEHDKFVQRAPTGLSSREPSGTSAQPALVCSSEEHIKNQDHVVIRPHVVFYRMFSLARSVDEFKQLLPSGGQFQEIINSIQPVQVFDVENHRAKPTSTTHPSPHEHTDNDLGTQLSLPLQRIYTKYHSVCTLLAAGLPTQAWSAFASLVRDAELFGLKEHANPVTTWDDTYNPEPSRQLWWLLMELDAQLSFLLGRRPCIDPSHRVPKPVARKVQHEGKGYMGAVLDLIDYMVDFLNHVHGDQYDRHTLDDKCTMLQSELIRLKQLQSTLPSLLGSGLANNTLSVIALHHIDVHLLLMVLYCQLLRLSIPGEEESGPLQNQRNSATKSYYKELLTSLRTIIDVFDYSYKMDPTITASSWPHCFGAFCAASMLGIARLQQEVYVDTDKDRIETALRIFVAFADAGQASGIAQPATEWLADILRGIAELEEQPDGSTRGPAAPPVLSEEATTGDDVSQSSRFRGSSPVPKIRTDGPTLKQSDTSGLQGDIRSGKRIRFSPELVADESSEEASAWSGDQHHQYTQAISFDNLCNVPLGEPAASEAFEQQPYPHNAATSFSDQMELYDAGYTSTYFNNVDNYHPGYTRVYPPMVYAPPLYDDWWQSQFQSSENITSDTSSQQIFFHPPLVFPMDPPRTLGDAMHSGQHPGFAHTQQTSPTQP